MLFGLFSWLQHDVIVAVFWMFNFISGAILYLVALCVGSLVTLMVSVLVFVWFASGCGFVCLCLVYLQWWVAFPC